MRRKLFRTQSDYEWLLDEFGFEWIFDALKRRSEEDQARFRQLFYERMLDAHSPLEVAQKAFGVTSPIELAQKVLGVTSPLEVAQKVLGATSPIELAQKVLGASSPVDAAFKLLQSCPEGRELLRRLEEEESLLVE